MNASTKIIILLLVFLPSFALAQLTYTPSYTVQSPSLTFDRTFQSSQSTWQKPKQPSQLIPGQIEGQIERIDPRTVKRLDIRKDTTEFERLDAVKNPSYKP